jgi:hypothetical protein
MLPPTPVRSKEYSALLDVADMTSNDSFDLFFGMFRYNPRAREHSNKIRDNMSSMECQLVAKESYIAATSEMRNNDGPYLYFSSIERIVPSICGPYVQKKKKKSCWDNTLVGTTVWLLWLMLLHILNCIRTSAGIATIINTIIIIIMRNHHSVSVIVRTASTSVERPIFLGVGQSLLSYIIGAGISSSI